MHSITTTASNLCHSISDTLAHHLPRETKITAAIKGSLLKLAEKIATVSKFLFNIILSALLYWTNPTLYAVGFLAGMVCEKPMSGAIHKITTVWKNQPIAATIVGSIACGLSLPVTLGAGSVLWAAHQGATLSLEAQSPPKKHASADVLPEKPLASGSG